MELASAHPKILKPGTNAGVWLKPSTIMLVASEYSSEPWDVDPSGNVGLMPGWGLFVLQAFEDVVRARLFSGPVSVSYQLHPADFLLNGKVAP